MRQINRRALSGREAIQFKSSTAALSVTAALCFLSCGFTSKVGYTHRVEGVLTHDAHDECRVLI